MAGPLRERALVGVRLPRVDLRSLHLAGLDFQSAILTDANLQGAVLSGCCFVKCSARRAVFADLEAEKVRACVGGCVGGCVGSQAM